MRRLTLALLIVGLVAYRLSGANGFAKMFVGSVTVNRWLPGSIDLFIEEFFREPKDLPPGEIVSVSDDVALPADMPVGQYTLSVGVVEEGSSSPVVNLAIKGRTKDGWYPISKVQIVK